MLIVLFFVTFMSFEFLFLSSLVWVDYVFYIDLQSRAIYSVIIWLPAKTHAFSFSIGLWRIQV